MGRWIFRAGASKCSPAQFGAFLSLAWLYGHETVDERGEKEKKKKARKRSRVGEIKNMVQIGNRE